MMRLVDLLPIDHISTPSPVGDGRSCVRRCSLGQLVGRNSKKIPQRCRLIMVTLLLASNKIQYDATQLRHPIRPGAGRHAVRPVAIDASKPGSMQAGVACDLVRKRTATADRRTGRRPWPSGWAGDS